MLNEWFGQREADVLKLPPWKATGAALMLQQSETGRWASLPVHLVARLKGEAEREKHSVVRRLPKPDERDYLLRHDRAGTEWNEHTFRHVFAEIRAAATAGVRAEGAAPAIDALPSCADQRFMEPRHTAVTRLHEAGVDEQGIAGSVRAILDRHYIVRTAKAAEGAFRKRLAAEA